jgi:hypothetical protein
VVCACSTVKKFHLSVNDNLNADKQSLSGISNLLLNLGIR